MWVTKSMPSTLVCKERGAKCHVWGLDVNDDSSGNPLPLVDSAQPRAGGELPVGLSPQRIASPLKALGRVCAMTLGS